MSGGSKNFKGNDFSARKEDINRGGRPRKLFRVFNEELKKLGVEEVGKAQLMEAYAIIFNTDLETLKEWANNDSTPIGLRIIIESLLNKKTRLKAYQEFKEWTFGRASNDIKINAQQSVDITKIWNTSDGNAGK